MKLIYMAHPFGGDPRNLGRAHLWYAWLLSEFPRNAYTANWIVEGELLDDTEPVIRAAALLRACEIVRRCDALVLVGGRIMSGMKQEADVARAVIDLTPIGMLPPKAGLHGWITTRKLGLAAGALEAFEELCPVTVPFDLVAHVTRQREWSRRTFGPARRTNGVLDHIAKELQEVRASPDDLDEWIDVIILALDGAWRHGHEPAEIVRALVDKQARNEARSWPDWRDRSEDEAIEHTRDAG